MLPAIKEWWVHTWTLICPPPGVLIIRDVKVGGAGGGYCGGGPSSSIWERRVSGSVALFRGGEGGFDWEDSAGIDFW